MIQLRSCGVLEMPIGEEMKNMFDEVDWITQKIKIDMKAKSDVVKSHLQEELKK